MIYLIDFLQIFLKNYKLQIFLKNFHRDIVYCAKITLRIDYCGTLFEISIFFDILLFT